MYLAFWLLLFFGYPASLFASTHFHFFFFFFKKLA